MLDALTILRDAGEVAMEIGRVTDAPGVAYAGRLW